MAQTAQEGRQVAADRLGDRKRQPGPCAIWQRIARSRLVRGGWLSRLARLVVTLFIVSVLTFFLINLLPGDPAVQILGPNNVTADGLRELREEMGLDEPVIVRYGTWLAGAVTGDLGQSFQSQQDVAAAIGQALPVTAELAIVTILIALAISIPLAMLAALRPGGWADSWITGGVLVGQAIPAFVTGLMFILVFAVWLGILPASGWVPITEGIGGNLRHIFLPGLCLALIEVTGYTRVLRSDMVTTLEQDYIALARSKGLTGGRVLFRHALRPSTLPLVTLVGVNVAGLLGGAIVVENVFALPGIGRLLISAIHERDYIMVQGIVLFVTVVYVVINALVDLFYRVLDPRIGRQ